MDTDMVYAKNLISKQVDLVPESYLTHPTFGPNLELVRNGKVRGRLSEIIDSDPVDPDEQAPAKAPETKKKDG